MKLTGGSFCIGIAIAFAFAAQPAFAGLISVANPGDPVAIGARIQNGGSGSSATDFKGEVFAGSPSSPSAQIFTPAWSYNTSHNFAVDYSLSTGQLKLSIDFGGNTGLQTAAWTFNQFAGEGFEFIQVAVTGNAVSNVKVSGLTINGQGLGGMNAAFGSFSEFFADENDGPGTAVFLGDLHISGALLFTGSGGAVDIPRLDVNLLNPDPPPQTAPEPSSIATFGLLAMVGCVWSLVRRRQQDSKSA